MEETLSNSSLTGQVNENNTDKAVSDFHMGGTLFQNADISKNQVKGILGEYNKVLMEFKNMINLGKTGACNYIPNPGQAAIKMPNITPALKVAQKNA